MDLQTFYDQHWPVGAISPDTQKMEARFFRAVLNELGDTELDAITGGDVARLQIKLRTTLAPASINRVLRIFKKILLAALDADEITALPRRWPKPLHEEPVRQELSAIEREKFLAVASGFLVVSLETGIDRSQLLALQVSAVDFQAGIIRLTRSKTSVSAAIPITLRCGLELQKAIGIREVGRIFDVSEDTITRQFLKAKKAAGIVRRFRHKDLRHSYGCFLAEAGVPVNAIARCMGHGSIKTTMRYARISDQAVVAMVLNRLQTQN